jgi:hypothetical protein
VIDSVLLAGQSGLKKISIFAKVMERARDLSFFPRTKLVGKHSGPSSYFPKVAP